MEKRTLSLVGMLFIGICLIGAYIYITPQTETEVGKGKIGAVVSILPRQSLWRGWEEIKSK